VNPSTDHSRADRRERGRQAHRRLETDLEPAVLHAVGPIDGGLFLARLEYVFHDLYEALAEVYGEEELAGVLDRLIRLTIDGAADRPERLRARDRVRIVDPGWFQRARHVGYCCYVDRFCGKLAALLQRLDYLAELGVTYLHLMPLLRPREGENDGGYAVADYRAVDPRLGTMDDLERLAQALHERDMSLCIDLVLNHTGGRA
jgi:amylosucrase